MKGKKMRFKSIKRSKSEAAGFWDLVRKPVPKGGYPHADQRRYDRKRLKSRLQREWE